MSILHSITESGQLPALTAFLLGLIVAMHPCSLAANIAAIGYIARSNIAGRRLLACGTAYAIGRVAGYSLLGCALVATVRYGIDLLSIGNKAGEWGETVLGAVLIVIGIYMLIAHFARKEEHCHTVKGTRRLAHGLCGSLLLGITLTVAFCPESAIVYFGVLIPMSAESTWGYLLPVVFAVAASLPAVALAWCFAYSITAVTRLRNGMCIIQRRLNIIVALLFIAAGVFCLLF